MQKCTEIALQFVLYKNVMHLIVKHHVMFKLIPISLQLRHNT